jgi:peroxiredoxin
MITTGQTAPDLSLLAADGTPRPLSSFFESESMLLIFMRHVV